MCYVFETGTRPRPRVLIDGFHTSTNTNRAKQAKATEFVNCIEQVPLEVWVWHDDASFSSLILQLCKRGPDFNHCRHEENTSFSNLMTPHVDSKHPLRFWLSLHSFKMCFARTNVSLRALNCWLITAQICFVFVQRNELPGLTFMTSSWWSLSCMWVGFLALTVKTYSAQS